MIKWLKRDKEAVLVSNWGKEYMLNPEIPNKIGRSHSEHIIIEDDLKVSRENSLITYNEETQTYYIEDLDSRHGTYLNGEKVTEKKELKSGDIISMGNYTKFTFEIR